MQKVDYEQALDLTVRLGDLANQDNWDFDEHVAEHERLYRASLDQKRSAWFVTKLRAYLTGVFSTRLPMIQLNTKRGAAHRVLADGFVSALLAGALLDGIIWWLEQGRPYLPSQAATYCSRLIVVIIKKAIGWE